MANEQRPIDAARHERVLRGFAGHLIDAGKMEAAEAVKSIIKGLKLEPTVDAVEVKRGRWKGLGFGDYSCSICSEEVSGNYYNYCPNCGAKMDGDGNG